MGGLSPKTKAARARKLADLAEIGLSSNTQMSADMLTSAARQSRQRKEDENVAAEQKCVDVVDAFARNVPMTDCGAPAISPYTATRLAVLSPQLNHYLGTMSHLNAKLSEVDLVPSGRNSQRIIDSKVAELSIEIRDLTEKVCGLVDSLCSVRSYGAGMIFVLSSHLMFQCT